MHRTSFNADWTVGPRTTYFAELAPGRKLPKSVTLPHDAMWERKRANEGNSNIACYPDGEYEYKKKFFVPGEYRDKRVTFEFESVYNQYQE